MNLSRQIITELSEAGFMDISTRTKKAVGHDHMLVIRKDEMTDAGGEFETDPGESDGHIHTVTLSGPQLVAIQTGQRLEIKTSKERDDQHDHDVVFMVQRLNPKG